MARKLRKLRADSGALAVEKARKNQNSLIIPCIRCKTGQTERLSTLAETGGENGGIIGRDWRLRYQCGMLTHGNTGEIRAEPNNAGRDWGQLAEAVGFEPTVGFHPRSVSNRVLSASQPRLRRVPFSRAGAAGQGGKVAGGRRFPGRPFPGARCAKG